MLEFDPIAHRYYVDGNPVDNVTRILEQFMDFSHVSREALAYARDLGTAVHIATQLDDLGDLVEESVAVPVRPYLAAYRKFKAEKAPTWVAIEERVFHPQHQVAGTLDRRGFLAGSKAILDIKSGIEHPAVALQTSAYLESFCAKAGEPALGWKRFALYLRDDATYRLREVDTPHITDFRDFLSALNVYRWKKRNNLLPKEEPCLTT